MGTSCSIGLAEFLVFQRTRAKHVCRRVQPPFRASAFAFTTFCWLLIFPHNLRGRTSRTAVVLFSNIPQNLGGNMIDKLISARESSVVIAAPDEIELLSFSTLQVQEFGDSLLEGHWILTTGDGAQPSSTGTCMHHAV
ncbi:hypothetical protein VNO78_04853 [Psophocarpus tetragonolobus]|uniref:Uncharacterized protein n=1 Tax=Psophocarpus tetragonolobus TaxID=3891 RepID=A0AAN9XXX7_PSOTE